jgi:hypothetical protein
MKTRLLKKLRKQAKEQIRLFLYQWDVLDVGDNFKEAQKQLYYVRNRYIISYIRTKRVSKL